MKYHLDKVIVAVFLLFSFLFIANKADANSHTKGRILLQVESHGEAWYVNPVNNLRYYMGRPADAFEMMRGFGLGATTRDINNFKINLAPERLKGRILLQVESHGEAYYVNPVDRKLHYLGRPADAFAIMRNLGLGITNANLATIPVGSLSDQGSVYNLVEGYIRENITSLSPEEEVLGGTFYVTSVRFVNAGEAIVDYEDGHIALTATATYTVSGNDVAINSFEVMTDKEANF